MEVVSGEGCGSSVPVVHSVRTGDKKVCGVVIVLVMLKVHRSAALPCSPQY